MAVRISLAALSCLKAKLPRSLSMQAAERVSGFALAMDIC